MVINSLRNFILLNSQITVIFFFVLELSFCWPKYLPNWLFKSSLKIKSTKNPSATFPTPIFTNHSLWQQYRQKSILIIIFHLMGLAALSAGAKKMGHDYEKCTSAMLLKSLSRCSESQWFGLLWFIVQLKFQIYSKSRFENRKVFNKFNRFLKLWCWTCMFYGKHSDEWFMLELEKINTAFNSNILIFLVQSRVHVCVSNKDRGVFG